MPPPSDDWRAALGPALDARVIVVIGASDAGKTTLVAALAAALASRGGAIGVVDADVGQSEIGPPATVGLGRVTGPLARLSEADLVALHFVGVSSPAPDIRGVVEATRRMTGRARTEGFARILVDTSGLVTGGPGVALKQRKIDAIDPDLVLALDRGGDCEAILRGYGERGWPRVVRLRADGRLRSRSQTARRRHRAAALERYLAGAHPVALDLARLTVSMPPGVPLGTCAGALCGLDDARGDTLALGVVQDVRAGVLRALSPLADPAAVTAVRIGREGRDGTPRGAGDPRVIEGCPRATA
jgi:polynucleotide 5'-hydroxyl-kinase GRC3/NOL9